MLKLKLSRLEQGFTLVEVMISILIVSMFVAVSLQSMVFAAYFKARAKGFNQAKIWIQEDLENLRYQASQLQNTSLRTDADPGATVLQVVSIKGFEPGDSLLIGTGSTSETIAVEGVDAANRTIRLSSGLTTAQSARAHVVATTKCNAGSTDTGFADHLQDNLTALSQGNANSTTKTFLRDETHPEDKTYTLTRTPTVRNVAPYEVLQLTYSVTRGGDPAMTIYTEVTPDAVFQCP